MRIQDLPFLCFHFYHNLDSHKSIFLGHLDNPRTEQSSGFHNHFYVFLQLACAKVKAQDQAMVHVCIEEKGQVE